MAGPIIVKSSYLPHDYLFAYLHRLPYRQGWHAGGMVRPGRTMDGWLTIADTLALLAGAGLLAILTWSAHARAAAHRRASRQWPRGGEAGERIHRAHDRRWRLT
jgi:hypothetical protein